MPSEITLGFHAYFHSLACFGFIITYYYMHDYDLITWQFELVDPDASNEAYKYENQMPLTFFAFFVISIDFT